MTRAHGKSKAGVEWSHDLVRYALDRFHRANLRTPTLLELKAGIPDMPSYATVRRRYGSAGAMFRFHGYLTRPPGAQLGRPCTLARDRRGRFLPKQVGAQHEEERRRGSLPVSFAARSPIPAR